MLYNSIEYLVFLPLVFLLYWFVFKSLRWQNLFIVIASYVFYGWWSWHFLLLITFTTLCSYFCGVAIGRSRLLGGGKNKLQFICAFNVIINLLILGVYKYYDFFVLSFAAAFMSIGIELNVKTLNLVLPVGISFYTFQALSYTIDVYKSKIEPTKDVIAFFSFMSFFPQLVAGPIERASHLLPQFCKPRVFNYDYAVDGMKLILWGLFKKMVVADNCADIVNEVWADYSTCSSSTLILVAILFTFQIYGDFSGYSDIAVGSAKLFGIELVRNFNVPYFSRNVAEFWRRWHVSLMRWFTDYIYIPLGGNRVVRWKVFRNTIIVFLVSGLWHGANWTFICWGLYHAILFLPLMILGTKKYKNTVADGNLFPNIKELGMMLSTFVLIAIGWIIFRAASISEAMDYIRSMAENWSMTDTFAVWHRKVWFFIVMCIVMEWFTRTKEHALQFSLPSRTLRWTMYLLLAFIIITQQGNQATFIYFQF